MLAADANHVFSALDAVCPNSAGILPAGTNGCTPRRATPHLGTPYHAKPAADPSGPRNTVLPMTHPHSSCSHTRGFQSASVGEAGRTLCSDPTIPEQLYLAQPLTHDNNPRITTPFVAPPAALAPGRHAPVPTAAPPVAPALAAILTGAITADAPLTNVPGAVAAFIPTPDIPVTAHTVASSTTTPSGVTQATAAPPTADCTTVPALASAAPDISTIGARPTVPVVSTMAALSPTADAVPPNATCAHVPVVASAATLATTCAFPTAAPAKHTAAVTPTATCATAPAVAPAAPLATGAYAVPMVAPATVPGVAATAAISTAALLVAHAVPIAEPNAHDGPTLPAPVPAATSPASAASTAVPVASPTATLLPTAATLAVCAAVHIAALSETAFAVEPGAAPTASPTVGFVAFPHHGTPLVPQVDASDHRPDPEPPPRCQAAHTHTTSTPPAYCSHQTWRSLHPLCIVLDIHLLFDQVNGGVCHCTDCIRLSPFSRLVTPDGIPSTAELFSPSERFRFDPIRPCAPFRHDATTSLSPSSPHFPLFLATSSSILDCSRVGVEGPLSLRL